MIKNNLRAELEQKKIQKATASMRYQHSKEDLLQIDPKQAQKELRYEKMFIEEANQYHAVIVYLDMLFEAVREMQADWVAARSEEKKAQKVYWEMVRELEQKQKTIITLNQIIDSCSSGEAFFLNMFEKAMKELDELRKAN